MILSLMTALALGQGADAPEVSFSQRVPLEALAGMETEDAVGRAGPDRSHVPAVIPPEILTLPAFSEVELAPGVRGLLMPVPGVRKVGVSVILHKGQLDLDGDTTVASYLTGWTMDVASARWGMAEMSSYTDMWDLSVGSWMEQRRTVVKLVAPKEALGRGLEVLEDVLLHPVFPEAEIKRQIKENKRYLLDNGPTDPKAIARSAVAYGWASPETPWGRRPDVKEWSKVRQDDLIARHQAVLSAPVTVLVTGDLTWDEAQPMLQGLVSHLGGEGEALPPADFTPPTERRVIAVSTPGLGQVQLMVRLAAPERGSEDQGAFELVNQVLGGSFLSRLNSNLREEKGLTYGAYSSYGPDQTRGLWTLRFDTAVDKTALAVGQVELELDRMAEGGMTDEELGWSRSQLISQWNGTLQTGSDAHTAAADWVEYGEDPIVAREYIVGLGAVDVARSQEVAARWLGPDAPRVWVMVGDGEVLRQQLDALGWQAEWITGDQALLGDL
ncbi:MAG: insulinase family protein [Deltaproteobacteria bacterium]|nr:insulinase family protein [Deltaproteobacteria bacterium]